MLDAVSGTLRNTWAFVMLLAYSRHQYVEFVFDERDLFELGYATRRNWGVGL
jgi:hypothetical protein